MLECPDSGCYSPRRCRSWVCPVIRSDAHLLPGESPDFQNPWLRPWPTLIPQGCFLLTVSASHGCCHPPRTPLKPQGGQLGWSIWQGHAWALAELLRATQSCQMPLLFPLPCERDLCSRDLCRTSWGLCHSSTSPFAQSDSPHHPQLELFLKHSSIDLSALFRGAEYVSWRFQPAPVLLRGVSLNSSATRLDSGEDEVVPGMEPEGCVPTSGSTRPWQAWCRVQDLLPWAQCNVQSRFLLSDQCQWYHLLISLLLQHLTLGWPEAFQGSFLNFHQKSTKLRSPATSGVWNKAR